MLNSGAMEANWFPRTPARIPDHDLIPSPVRIRERGPRARRPAGASATPGCGSPLFKNRRRPRRAPPSASPPRRCRPVTSQGLPASAETRPQNTNRGNPGPRPGPATAQALRQGRQHGPAGPLPACREHPHGAAQTEATSPAGTSGKSATSFHNPGIDVINPASRKKENSPPPANKPPIPLFATFHFHAGLRALPLRRRGYLSNWRRGTLRRRRRRA